VNSKKQGQKQEQILGKCDSSDQLPDVR